MDAVVIDTDVFSLLFKGDTRSGPYSKSLRGKQMCISFMSVAELLCWGMLRNWGNARRRTLEDAIKRCIIVPYDSEMARAWARITAARTRAGRPISCGDCWIAATALRRGIPLVTHNAADFAGIEGLELLGR